MYENHIKSTSEHAPRTLNSGDTVTPRTDPKYVRESFTLRRMQPWQIAALAIVAAVVVGVALFYI